MKINSKTIETLGWFGASAILIAYGLNLIGTISAQNLIYIFLNLGGAFFVGLSALVRKDKPAVLIEWTWVLFSLVALFNLIFR